MATWRLCTRRATACRLSWVLKICAICLAISARPISGTRITASYDIEIVAEINHAPQLAIEEIIAQAERFVSEGADVIDLGCDPGETWKEVDDAVRSLRDRGIRVSIDSFNPDEVSRAVSAGAELVLSVNAANREHAADWGVEVVAIPDRSELA